MRSYRPSLKNPPTPPSIFSRLPLEIIESIIAHLIYDRGSLHACSLTCYSFYIAAVPHLHSALTIGGQYGDRKFLWPNPIRHIHKLGLFPLVEDLRIFNSSHSGWISQKLFNSRILRQFTAFTSIQCLTIGSLDIPSFMPTIQRYFGLPTVKSLTLASPKGSHQQVIFFIGSFEHLENLMFHDDTFCSSEEGPALVPPFIPPLGERLTAWRLRKAGILGDMIRSFGGIKFSEMDIFDVAETRLLLSACSETLLIVQLHPNDPHGELLDPNRTASLSTNIFTAMSSLLDFDLSQNMSLQKLEITAGSVDRALALGTASRVLKYAMSTIRSPDFSQVALIYQEHNFRGVNTEEDSEWPHLREVSKAEREEEASQHHKRFELLREMHIVRCFESFLCANVWDPVGEYTVRALREAAKAGWADEPSDGSFSEPFVTYNPHWDLRCGVYP